MQNALFLINAYILLDLQKQHQQNVLIKCTVQLDLYQNFQLVIKQQTGELGVLLDQFKIQVNVLDTMHSVQLLPQNLLLQLKQVFCMTCQSNTYQIVMFKVKAVMEDGKILQVQFLQQVELFQNQITNLLVLHKLVNRLQIHQFLKFNTQAAKLLTQIRKLLRQHYDQVHLM